MRRSNNFFPKSRMPIWTKNALPNNMKNKLEKSSWSMKKLRWTPWCWMPGSTRRISRCKGKSMRKLLTTRTKMCYLTKCSKKGFRLKKPNSSTSLKRIRSTISSRKSEMTTIRSTFWVKRRRSNASKICLKVWPIRSKRSKAKRTGLQKKTGSISSTWPRNKRDKRTSLN